MFSAYSVGRLSVLQWIIFSPRSISLAIPSRGHPGEAAEFAGEVALICETTGSGDFGEGFPRRDETTARDLESQALQVLLGRESILRGEGTLEGPHRQTHGPGELRIAETTIHLGHHRDDRAQPDVAAPLDLGGLEHARHSDRAEGAPTLV